MLESANAKELGRIRRIESAEGLADLFFRADTVRSAKEASSTDNLRRTYRDWRTGNGDAHAHPDVLTFNHAATTDEQRSDAKKVDHRSDVYSLGVCLWEMCSRRFPWHTLLEQAPYP